MHRMVWKEEIL